MKQFMKKFMTNESGATAIEYALIAGLISVAAIVAMTDAGNSVKGVFNRVSDELDSAATAT